MSGIILLSFLITSINFNPNAYNIDEIRAAFHQAVLDECQIDDFYQLALSIGDTDDAVALSYKAAGYVMKAKNTWNPIENLRLVSNYKKKINEAVHLDPSNAEVRFLRFSIGFYLPDILGLRKNIIADKEAIIENLCQFDLQGIDPEFNRFILWFIENSGHYNDAEVSLFRDYFSIPSS